MLPLSHVRQAWTSASAAASGSVAGSPSGDATMPRLSTSGPDHPFAVLHRVDVSREGVRRRLLVRAYVNESRVVPLEGNRHHGLRPLSILDNN